MRHLIITALCLCVYIYGLIHAKKINNRIWTFAWTSVGLFFLLLILMPDIKNGAEHLFIFMENGAGISIPRNITTVSLIEAAVVISYIAGWDMFRIHEKILHSILAVLSVFMIDAISITVMVCGNHADSGHCNIFNIIGEVIFYVLMVILYFYTFTWRHINRIKIGVDK